MKTEKKTFIDAELNKTITGNGINILSDEKTAIGDDIVF